MVLVNGPRSLSSAEVGFVGVPPTVMVQCLHRGFNHPERYECAPKNVKIGSLQMFMKNIGCCEDMGPRDFPVEELQKISVFDIRMVNTDRHAGNILVSKEDEEGRIVLIPIDHGYCLPENFYGWDLSIECARTIRISTIHLKKGVERGLTPFAIGNIMCQETLNKESLIEEIVREAQDSLIPGMSEATFLETVSQILDFQLDKLTK